MFGNLEGSRPQESRKTGGVEAAAVGFGLLAASFALPWPAASAGAALAGYGLAAALALRGRAAHHPHSRFGLANAITLFRAAGVAIFAGLALAPGTVAGPAGWAAAAGAAALLALDGADGWAARRQHLASDFGARFDMEVDAALILALAALAFGLGKAGPWVLALGLMRYAFVAAGWLWPRLAEPLPPSFRRKAVCALQVGALALLLAPPIAPPVSDALAAAALAALAWSFAVDLLRLARRP